MAHENNHYSWEITLSVNIDFLGTWTQEVLHYCDTNFMWYAIKHEQRSAENNKLHLHIGAVKEIGHRYDDPKRGAVAAGNLAAAIKNNCPTFGQYIFDNTQKRAIKCHPMTSDVWFTTYMTKEAECVYHRMPKDFTELTPYFSDLQLKKPKNEEYARISKAYIDEGNPLPATAATVWDYLSQHMLIDGDMKEWSQKQLQEKPPRIAMHINKEIPGDANPHIKKQKKCDTSSFGSMDRTCRFCPDQDDPNTVEYRKQKCFSCLLSTKKEAMMHLP